MSQPSQPTVSLWSMLGAYVWYSWGLSLCYWGIRMADSSFYRAGVSAFTRSVRAWPHFASGYYRRGLIRGRELHEHAEGIADLTLAIACAPEWPEPYLQRGLLQRFHGDMRAAREDLLRYLALGGAPNWRGEAERQIVSIDQELSAADDR